MISMKEFNLEEAKSGNPVCTRDGRDVTIIGYFEEKDHKKAYSYAHKIKPSLDLLGLNVAYEEILQIEAWTKTEGKKKEIKEVYKSVAYQVEKAVKEIRKDFNL